MSLSERVGGRTAGLGALTGVLGVLAEIGYLPLAALGIALIGSDVGDGSIDLEAVMDVLFDRAVSLNAFGALGGVPGGRL